MISHQRFLAASVLAIALAASACGSDTTAQGSGTLRVSLTDAPFSTDSVSRVDVYVVRVDVKMSESDSAESTRSVTEDSAKTGGWTTVATPNSKLELLALRNGLSTLLGTAAIPAGDYRSVRLIIDPSQSSVTLKGGQVLTSTSSPSVSFPSAARSGIKINLSQPVTVVAGGTSNLLVDFDVAQSFVLRGNSLAQNGLLFKPTIKGTVTTGTTTTPAKP